MTSNPLTPIPRLLTPPGDSIDVIRVFTNGQITVAESTQSPPQLFLDALKIRTDVFVVGQNCDGSLELDGEDSISWHWVTYAENEDKLDIPAATIRLVPAQAHLDSDDLKAVDGPNYKGSLFWDHQEPYVKITRLATMDEFRGRGFGKVLMDTALQYAGSNKSVMVKDRELGEWKGLVLIHAQKYLEGWYTGLGFQTDAGLGVWLEERIEHVGMWKRVPTA